jgi:hypothetical protein
MNRFLYILFIFICTVQLVGQTKINSKLYAKDLKLANSAFEQEDYLNAINLYRKVLGIDGNNEIANLNSIISRLNLNQPVDSNLLHIVKLQKSETPEVQFYFGKFYHLTGNFEQAINCFKKYNDIAIKYRTIPNDEVNYRINCSKNAIELISQPHRSIIKNIGNTINSPNSEYAPLIAPDESIMYFTSRREGSTGNLKDIYGNNYEDVYVCQKNDEGKWSEPKNVGPPINTNTHDACVALSFDGNQMMIYRTSDDMLTGDLYISRIGFNGWTNPEKLGPEINTPFIETSACFSTDTSVIYFSSNKPGGLGGKDIYRIKKLPNGRWSSPMNLGATINTEKDDDSPFLHPDGTTLYFSSKGHNTMGEYDVFKTILNQEKNTFSTPENLGFPINTVNNDIFFVLNANGTHGYYSSIKEETFGGSDIYMIDTRFGDNDLKVKQGKVIFENEPNKAKITIIDIESKQVSGIYNANSKTGKFILVMNPVKSYKAIIEEDGFQTMILDIEPIASDAAENDLIISLTKKH